jgi:enamine deaminase RidA (YjgF/YER057c/UK114 family)
MTRGVMVRTAELRQAAGVDAPDDRGGAAVDRRLKELGIVLGPPFPPVGSYVNSVHVGDQLVLGGQVPWEPPDRIVLGRLGQDLDVEQGREAARLAALNALNAIAEALGGLDEVRRVISLRGVVNATADFTEHTRVIDAASDVFVDVFGERGRHARLAVGVSSLPANMALEIELVLQTRNSA